MTIRLIRPLLLPLVTALALAGCVHKHVPVRMPVDDAELAWIQIHTRYESARGLLKETEHAVELMAFPDPERIDVALYRHVLLDCFADEIALQEGGGHVACAPARASNLRDYLVSVDDETAAIAIATWRQVDDLRVVLRVDIREELRALEEVVGLSVVETHRLREVADDMRRLALVEDIPADQRQRAEQEYALVSRRVEAIEVLQEQAAQELDGMRESRRALLDDVAANIARYGTE